MNPTLLRTYRAYEEKRKMLMALLSSVPDEKFHYRPPGKWSVSQILSHLIQAEKASLDYMKKKSLGIEQAGNTGKIEALKFFLLKISQRLPLKYKAPDILGKNDPPSLPLKEIEKNWALLREDLRAFLEMFGEAQLRRKVYRHVIAGRLNVLQSIEFFDEHLDHHLPQIKRLLQ